MRKKYMEFVIFILSGALLLISMKLFWNMGIYVDEYGVSPNIIYGGNFWSSMDFLRLFILGVLSIMSLIKLFN